MLDSRFNRRRSGIEKGLRRPAFDATLLVCLLSEPEVESLRVARTLEWRYSVSACLCPKSITRSRGIHRYIPRRITIPDIAPVTELLVCCDMSQMIGEHIPPVRAGAYTREITRAKKPGGHYNTRTCYRASGNGVFH